MGSFTPSGLDQASTRSLLPDLDSGTGTVTGGCDGAGGDGDDDEQAATISTLPTRIEVCCATRGLTVTRVNASTRKRD